MQERQKNPLLPESQMVFPSDTDVNLPLIPGGSVLLYPTLSLHGEFRYGNSGGYSGEPGDLPKILRGMPDIQAQHSCTIPARHTLLRTGNILGPVKSKNDGLLLSRVRDLYRARARHRVFLRQAVKEFLIV